MGEAGRERGRAGRFLRTGGEDGGRLSQTIGGYPSQEYRREHLQGVRLSDLLPVRIFVWCVCFRFVDTWTKLYFGTFNTLNIPFRN